MRFGYVFAAGALAVGGIAIASLAVVQQIVATDAPRREPLHITAVRDSSRRSVTLTLNETTRAPGQYAIWVDAGRGYAQPGGYRH